MNGSSARTRTAALWTVFGAAATFVAIACSDSISLPPVAPDCNASKDAGACTPAPVGGGGASAPPGGGEIDGETPPGADGATGCGTAGSMVLTSSLTCTPCIETGAGSSTGTSCCAADLACSADTACLTILACANTCVNNASCVEACVDASPSGAQDFDDFAQCLTLNCSPECPSLTASVGGDP